jgi:hypothetical protein
MEEISSEKHTSLFVLSIIAKTRQFEILMSGENLANIFVTDKGGKLAREILL